MTRPVASVRRYDIPADMSRAEQCRHLARERIAATKEARALVVDLLPDPGTVRRKYEDFDALGEIIRRSRRKPAGAAFRRALAARNALVELNLPLAAQQARVYRSAVYAEELAQEARIGLIDAANRYNPDHETTFATYAAWWIRARMMRAMTVLQPVSTAHGAVHHAGIAKELREEGLSDEEIADRMGLPLDRVRYLRGVEPEVVSLDFRAPAPDGSEHRFIHEILEDPDIPDEDALLHAATVARQMEQARPAIEALEPRQREILLRRFGFIGHDSQTLAEIGRALGVSRERVRQLEALAMAELREAFLPGRKPKPKPSTMRERLVELLRRRPWLTAPRAAELLGVGRSLHGHLQALYRQGRLIRIPEGRTHRYALPGTPLPEQEAA